MNITVDTRELRALAGRLEVFRSKVVPLAAGILTKQVKVLSQQQQVDYRGTAFKPLTPAYKRRKIKAGHPGIPNLTFTGKFMDRIGLRSDTLNGLPYVGPIESFQPQAEGLDKKRKIWGVNPDSEKKVEESLEQAFNSIVNAAA